MSRHLAALGGEARFTGSDGNARARRYCIGALREAGYRVTEEEFSFSSFTGRFGAALIGAIVAATFHAVAMIATTARPPAMLAVMTAGLAAVAAFGASFGGSGVLRRRVASRIGTSIVATRGEAPPAVWLVAHVDSKWQPVSILVRAAGVIILTAAAIVLFGALVLSLIVAPVPGDTLRMIALTGVFGAVPLALSVAGDGSHGAADNASGVAAVLEAAEQLVDEPAVGVVITDAEELGLVGAYAFTRGRRAGIAINCDTIDDSGGDALTVMTFGRSSAGIASAVNAAAAREGMTARAMRLIPGILTDSVAFAKAGWRTVTVSKGDLSTLARIHTKSDSLRRLRGDGVIATGRVLAGAARELA